MADNINVTPGTGKTVLADEVIHPDLGTGIAQVIKIIDGTTDGTTGMKVDASGFAQVKVAAALPAGSNNIGDVDVLSLPALPSGSNTIGDVTVSSLPALPTGANTIGKVDQGVGGASAWLTKSEVQADFDTGGGTQSISLQGIALPASGGAVVGGTGTNPIRVDVTGSTAQPVTDNGGSLTVDGSVSITGAIPAGTNNIGDVDVLTLPASTLAASTVKSADFDTAAGTDTVTMFGLAIPASGGAAAAGHSANPLRVDPTGTTTQPVSFSGALPTGSNTIGAVTQASGPWTVNETQVGGTAIATGNGTASAGCQRVTIASDNTAFAVNATLQAGTAAFGKLSANDGVDIGDVTINNAASAGVYIRPGSSVNLDTSNVTLTGSLPAGTNNIGDVDVLTLPAATNAGATAKTSDYDSGAGTDTVTMFGIALPASGGAVQGGTNTNPVRIDPTGTTTQPVSGTVTANAGSGTFTVAESQLITDNAGFTDGTSKLYMGGFIFDEVAGTALAENDAAAARIDSKRAMVFTLEDATTRGRRATISAAGALLTDASATTQPISAASLPLPSGAATAAKQPALGTAGTASADVITIQGIASMTAIDVNQTQVAGNAVSTGNGTAGTGCQRVTIASDNTAFTVNAAQSGTWNVTVNTALPAGTNAIGKLSANDAVDIGDVTINNASSAPVPARIGDGTNQITLSTAPGDAASNSSNRFPTLSHMLTFNGTTWDRVRSGLTTVQTSATGIMNMIPLAQFNSSAPTLSNTNTAPLQVDSSGNLKTLPQATENHLGEVGGRSRTINGSVTRPADTNVYAVGDAITDSTSAPTVLTFSGCARINQGSGTILGATLIDSANQTTKGDFDLFLFDTTYTVDNDNAAFTPTDAEMETAVGVISFLGGFAKAGDATSGAGGNLIYAGQLGAYNDPIVFQCGAASTSLFGALVARNAYTPVSGEKFTIRLRIAQD